MFEKFFKDLLVALGGDYLEDFTEEDVQVGWDGRVVKEGCDTEDTHAVFEVIPALASTNAHFESTTLLEQVATHEEGDDVDCRRFSHAWLAKQQQPHLCEQWYHQWQ